MPASPIGAKRSTGKACEGLSKAEGGLESLVQVSKVYQGMPLVKPISTRTVRTFPQDRKEEKLDSLASKVRRTTRTSDHKKILKQTAAIKKRRRELLESREQKAHVPKEWRALEEFPAMPSIEQLEKQAESS